MGAQLTGGNAYSPYAAMAAKHGGAGNAQMFNQQTAPMQYQQGLDQQGMTMQGIAGLMSAIAGAVQRHRDMAALYGRQEPHPMDQSSRYPGMGSAPQGVPSQGASTAHMNTNGLDPSWFGLSQFPSTAGMFGPTMPQQPQMNQPWMGMGQYQAPLFNGTPYR